MAISKIYSVLCDSIEQEGSNNWITHNGVLIEAFTACDGESDDEMISAGFCRVEVENITDGGETLWAKVSDLKSASISLDDMEICGCTN